MKTAYWRNAVEAGVTISGEQEFTNVVANRVVLWPAAWQSQSRRARSDAPYLTALGAVATAHE